MPRPDPRIPVDTEPNSANALLAPVRAAGRPALWLPRWSIKLLTMLIGLLVFILALLLLKQGAKVYGGVIIKYLNISSPVNSLGFGWLLAYIFLSGSPVAAIAVS